MGFRLVGSGKQTMGLVNGESDGAMFNAPSLRYGRLEDRKRKETRLLGHICSMIRPPKRNAYLKHLYLRTYVGT